MTALKAGVCVCGLFFMMLNILNVVWEAKKHSEMEATQRAQV